jgi:hypothetical protein
MVGWNGEVIEVEGAEAAATYAIVQGRVRYAGRAGPVPLRDLRHHREALAMVDGNCVDYKLNGDDHIFLFDMYDVGADTIIEVKSTHTLKTNLEEVCNIMNARPLAQSA